MIDAHIHLHEYENSLLIEQIEKWQDAGIQHVIAVANDLKSSYQTLELQRKFPRFVFACIGFHPEYALPPQRDIIEWKQLVKVERKRISAIGEIGLPHYQLPKLADSLEHYQEFLYELFTVAHSYHLPVALHAVHDKAELVFQLLQQVGIEQAHFHWLKATSSVLQKIIAAGYYISITPEVCYRKRDVQLAKQVPIKQLLIETDGPWLFDERFAAEQTTPLFLHEIVKTLAEIKAMTTCDIAKQTAKNTKACYGIK